MVFGTKVFVRMRVLLGIKDVSGVAWRIRCGLKIEGVECDFVNLYPHRHTDQCSSDYPRPFLITLVHKITHALHIQEVEGWKRILLLRLFLGLKVLIFLSCILRYDAFIYFGGMTFFSDSHHLNVFHLWLLRALNKKVIIFLFGSEVRPDYMDGFLSQWKNNVAQLKNKKKYLSLLERYSNYIIAPSSCVQLHETPIVNLISFCLPHPTEDELGDLRPVFSSPMNKCPMILHAPSEVSVKGTSEVRSIMKELNNEGLEFEYVEISGASRYQVLQAVNACDFVVDQVFSDFPMASFATEASFFGKPSVVGGYYSELVRADVQSETLPPSVYVMPDQLKNSIRNLVNDSHLRNELSKKAWNYARNNAAPSVIAQKILRLLEDDVPDDWFFDPNKSSYLYGWGVRQRELISILHSYIDDNGIEALQLSDKPSLEQAFLNLSRSAEKNNFPEEEGVAL